MEYGGKRSIETVQVGWAFSKHTHLPAVYLNLSKWSEVAENHALFRLICILGHLPAVYLTFAGRCFPHDHHKPSRTMVWTHITAEIRGAYHGRVYLSFTALVKMQVEDLKNSLKHKQAVEFMAQCMAQDNR